MSYILSIFEKKKLNKIWYQKNFIYLTKIFKIHVSNHHQNEINKTIFSTLTRSTCDALLVLRYSFLNFQEML